jgi:hypothetical protein
MTRLRVLPRDGRELEVAHGEVHHHRIRRGVWIREPGLCPLSVVEDFDLVEELTAKA